MPKALQNAWLAGGLTCAVAGVMFLAAASKVTERTNPELAMALFPYNAQALARSADEEFTAAANALSEDRETARAGFASASAKARQSLKAWPLNPRALRILALTEEAAEPNRGVLLAGHTLSRRDTQTQIFLIEAAARQGEIGAAMEHYDAVLRRRSGFRDAAGRNLALAISQPEILEEVAKQLAMQPSWASLLYYYALRTPESYSSFVELHRMLAGQDVIPPEFSAQFAQVLTAQGRFDDAVTVADLAGAAGLSRAPRITDTSFQTEPQYPGAWVTVDDAAAYLQPLNGGSALLSLSSGTTGTVAYRLVALPQGQYSATLSLDADQEGGFATTANPEARLSCAKAGTVTAGSPDLRVTEDCPYQWLAIHLPETQVRPADVLIKAVTITPRS